MKLDLYLNYAGNCEEAFRFYEKHIGGKIGMMMRHEDNMNPGLPPDFGKKILHAQLEVGGATLMGADIPGAEPMRSAYAVLSDGGQIFMKMESTFFAARFAMLRDKFGTSWMLLAAHPSRT